MIVATLLAYAQGQSNNSCRRRLQENPPDSNTWIICVATILFHWSLQHVVHARVHAK